MNTKNDEIKNLNLQFNADGLIPAIAIDHITNRVLMMAWMNQIALEKTIETGEAHYWSRSRQELWHKGATSGHYQKVKEISVDCDQDTILISVKQIGGKACHTDRESCFYRYINLEGADGQNLYNLPLVFKDKE